jgi:hypothetical protein
MQGYWTYAISKSVIVLILNVLYEQEIVFRYQRHVVKRVWYLETITCAL